MANRTTLTALIVGIGVWLMASAVPIAAWAGGCCSPPSPPPSCNCQPPPCCAPPTPPPPAPCNCSPNHNIVVPSVNVFVAPSVVVNVQANASATAAAQTQAQTFVGGGGGASGIIAGPVSAVNLGVGGGSEREAYEATRTRFEKVVIQAFCFDDKEVPHPASQVGPDRDINEMYEGEIYRCIAGTHMQVTIAQWAEHVSFDGGQTLTCHKGDALYHTPGKGGGALECRPQKPARDCNERSLLRRFGAGVKVLTLLITEKYTAYREVQHSATVSQVMSLDGGVGGVVY